MQSACRPSALTSSIVKENDMNAEHPPKTHPISALIFLVVMVALVILLIGALNTTATAALASPIFLGWVLYVWFKLSKPDDPS